MGARAPASYLASRRLFLIGLGLVHGAAFLSLWVQVHGLFGARGIVPLAPWLAVVGAELEGLERLRVPTLLWLGAGDAALHVLCASGVLASAALVLGLVPRASALALWVLYLSLVSVGAPFLSFQWDVLLLEASLLAVFYAPGGLRPFRGAQRVPSAIVRALLAWLLFRLMFQSGLVKLQSGDAVWRDLTALDYHYWTQPLPHRLAHWAHHLPALVGRACVAVMFAIELACPFLLFWPGAPRRVALGAVALLMAAISATGNYGFFNLLTVVLCLPLVDDALVARVPGLRRLVPGETVPAGPPRRRAARVVGSALVLLLVPYSAWSAGWWREPPAPVRDLYLAGTALRSVNAYGLFRDLTEERPEIVVEGSRDGRTWEPYRFRWKPGELDRAPACAGLHMPRLDWQMWFAALRGAPPDWYWSFVRRLLEGSPDVLALLAADPFGGRPPRYVRGRLCRYSFGSPGERTRGTWWRRAAVGPYGGAVTLGPGGGLRRVDL